jgi:hypothetical protein
MWTSFSQNSVKPAHHSHKMLKTLLTSRQLAAPYLAAKWISFSKIIVNPARLQMAPCMAVMWTSFSQNKIVCNMPSASHKIL